MKLKNRTILIAGEAAAWTLSWRSGSLSAGMLSS